MPRVVTTIFAAVKRFETTVESIEAAVEPSVAIIEVTMKAMWSTSNVFMLITIAA